MGFMEKFKSGKDVDEVDNGLPYMNTEPSLGETLQQSREQQRESAALEKVTSNAAENDGLPSVNRKQRSNKLVTILGFVFILGAAAAMLVAVNGNKEPKKKKAAGGPAEQVSNNLPPITIPPPPRPINIQPPAPTEPSAIRTVGTQVPPIKLEDASGRRTILQTATRTEGGVRTDAAGVFAGQTTGAARSANNGKAELTWDDRKMGGNLLVESKGGSPANKLIDGLTKNLPKGLGGEADDDQPTLGFGSGSKRDTGGGDTSELSTRLEPTVTRVASASLLPDRNFLITKGTSLDCALETAIDSTLPGITTCRLTRDVYSDNGQVLLLDRGAQLVGEYQGAMKQGQARLFVLWSRAKTPHGVVVNLNSPGTDALGRSGVEGWVDNKFVQRFGAAILFSVIKDSIAIATANQQTGGSVVYGNTQSTGEQAIGKILDSTINIPPTLTKNQGDHIQVMVARDLDFSSVYSLQVEK